MCPELGAVWNYPHLPYLIVLKVGTQEDGVNAHRGIRFG